VSLRGLLFFLVAIVIGGAAGIGGYWAYDTYFPPPERLLDKAKEKFDKGNQAYQDKHLDQARKLYEECNAYLGQLNRKVEAGEAKDFNMAPAHLLHYRVLAKLYTFQKEDDAKAGKANDPDSPSATLAKQSNAALNQVLQSDRNNAEAAAILLDKCFAEDDLDKGEFYAETLVKVKLEELAQGEESKYFDIKSLQMETTTSENTLLKELPSRIAASHFLMARRALRGPNPKPELALEHLRAIEAMSIGGKKDKRWRELALETQALKIRLDMARQQAASGVKQAKGVVKEDVAKELAAKIDEGMAKAKKDTAEQVPGDGTNPPTPYLASLNPTNVRGVLDFLVTAIETSTTKEEVIERANLLLVACDQIVSVKKPREASVKAVAAHLAQLPGAVDKPAEQRKVPALRLLAADWAPIEGRMIKVVETTTTAGAALDPEAYLELARKAHKDGRWKDAEEMAKRGLEVARKNKQDEKFTVVKQLHGEAAWAMFMQHKTAAAEAHLAVMRKERGLARTANMIDGLTAVREGRHETGVRNLVAAQQDPRYARSVIAIMGLARAYEGLSQMDRALVNLRKLDAIYKSSDTLTDEERTLAADFLPDADTVALEAMRCHLALNQVEPALEYKKRLEQRPNGMAARMLLINHYVTAGREELARGNPLDARDDFDAARKELALARKTNPDEPALVWADIILTASQPDLSRPFGLQASAGSPKAGPSSVEKAEEALKSYVAKRGDFPSHLLWVRWLESQGRYDDAAKVLGDMEQHFGDRKKVIEALKARLALVRDRSSEAGKLVAALRGSMPDLNGDVLQVLYLLNETGTRSHTLLDTVLGLNESNVLFHLWDGQRKQHAGQYADAVRSYGRALTPGRYQAEAQIGLLTSLLALADKDSPRSAAELIDELRRDNIADPVVLLAYAEMNRRLDNVLQGRDGRDSMEAGCRMLERALGRDSAVAADFLARGFYAAGRADLARSEVERALQLNREYPPALALAARVAAEAGDHEACLSYAEDLERVLYGTPEGKREAPVAAAPHSVLDRTPPTMVTAHYWRAAALEALGRKEEAKRVYQDMMAKHPNLSTGYLGLAGMRERAGDLPGALEYVRQWREKNPADAEGLTAEVRLLVKAGKLADAEQAAEGYAKGKDATSMLVAARAFAAARAYDQAEAYGRKAVEGASQNRAILAEANLVVGDACMDRARSKQGDARKADVEKALAAYKAVWALQPGNPAAGLHMAYLQAKEQNEADAAYAVAQQARKGLYSQRMIGGDRLSLEQLDILGDVYRLSKHAGDAVALFREAVKRYPQEPGVHLQLGLAYRDQRMVREAMSALSQAQLTAQQRADTAKDADQKARWQSIADNARKEREKLEIKPATVPTPPAPAQTRKS
jgi:tetratricopeptide (TPR) repeat protein